ncbi:hypothetical protein GCM10023189_12540 [Nibrella saemangeumensis]|uniref:DUF11 domain-containing protein n=2 Tax=Nibrella saemangeumensis TaxID=1084526 RepID=A0ABP8MKT0_9BACT
MGYCQQVSPNTVNYRVTYDAATNRYTAFVIPNYNVPNSNNTGSVERGGTAQYTLKVPAQFVIQDIQDIRGTWEKNPLKLGPGQPNQDFSGTGLDPAFAYYVIGKSPSETDYGSFQAGVPVALFSFAGNGCFGPVTPLPPNDPFIVAADQRFSLNVGNSFYSRSGQPAGGNVVPLEQFVNISGPAANCQTGTVATPDNATTTAGTLVVVPILNNDLFNGGPASTTNVTASITGAPSSGTATVNANGTVNFTPAPGFTGPISFTYTICSISTPPQCASAVVTVTVNPVTQPTSTVANPDNSTTTAGVPVTTSVLANDLRNGGPASTTNVTVSVTGAPSSGTATVNANGTITFTPAPGFTGPVSYTYTICSIATPVQCAPAVVTVQVNAVTPPTSTVANPDNTTTAAGTAVTTNVLANDTRNGGPASTTNVTVSITGAPSSGTATVNANGTITFTPAPGFTGPVSYTYTICSIATPVQCATAVVTVTVNPGTQPTSTVATNDNATTTTGTPVIIPILANDTRNGGPASTTNVTASITGVPSSGTATVNANGTVTFTPAPGFTGPVSFTYTICSIATPVQCATAVVAVTVNPITGASADVRVTKVVSQAQSTVGGVVSFTVTVQNVGPGTAANVVVTDTITRSTMVQMQGPAIVSRGSFNSTTGLWTVGTLAAGESATMVMSVQLRAEGVITNTASVSSTTSDPNSGNNVASACVSVPVQLCQGEALVITIPAGFQNVQWFRNGQAVTGGVTSTSITITQGGTYTVTAGNGACPLGGNCCPIIVQAVDCCQPVCVPFVISKTRSTLVR